MYINDIIEGLVKGLDETVTDAVEKECAVPSEY